MLPKLQGKKKHAKPDNKHAVPAHCMSSESFQEQSLHSCYSEEQAELLAPAPGINTLTSSQHTEHICEGCFRASAPEGEVAAWHVGVLPGQEASCSSQGTPCRSTVPWGDAPRPQNFSW